MFSIEEYEQRVGANVRRIDLAQEVIEEVHRSLLNPLYVDEKADLLISAEALAESTFMLLYEIREMVWNSEGGPESPENEEVSEN